MSTTIKIITSRVLENRALQIILYKNLKSTYYTLTKLNKTNPQKKPSNNVFKYGLIFASTVVAYKLFKNRFVVPAANASSARRQNYNFIADVVETCSPSVVYIEIKDIRRLDFFTGKPMTISNGSGFIIKSDGLIVTNAHVVTNKPQAKVEVRLLNGQVYNGIVEDVDIQSDLATVRIQAKNLPVMNLGNSAELRPGEFVVAIGSPLSLSNTVTSGVVSSTHRGADELGIRGKDMNYIQTDAAITFGNSGGPLVNLDGEAIGVNSMKVTAGISFAIPINYVKQFLNNTKGNKGTAQIENARRRYMGITMLTLTPEIIFEMQQRDQYVPSSITHGVLVWKVMLGSPAHSGGLQPGDIVTEINNKSIKSANDVYSVLSESKTKTLSMTVIRLGKLVSVSVIPEDIN
ncbi:hypothetical protein RN001_009009 [Aquatica leii]|uniref:Serine protease HTRA2, mitochondrial n=1 Tax=Aquatica leii TaxID=1421715 RepID=A0AAN7P612_9COLE|nr:hypothetical protein RN001_009009 [Aquatica leii]